MPLSPRIMGKSYTNLNESLRDYYQFCEKVVGAKLLFAHKYRQCSHHSGLEQILDHVADHFKR